MAIIAFRTDEELDEKLRRAARLENKTKTEVIREALDEYFLARKRSGLKLRKRTKSVADVLADDIGIWEGPAESSVRTGEQLRKLLGEKH
jgi:predicted transcriptional regulator